MSVTFGLPILFRFPSNPCLICRYPCFLLQNISSVSRRGLSPFVALERTQGARMRGGGGGGHSGGKKKFADSRVKLFWRAIYCANPRPNPGSQSGSRSCRGLKSRAPRIMLEYGLAIAIAIRPLIQPRTCEMGSSIFAAMSQLKFASTTRASLLSMLSTERTNRENCFRCSWQGLPCLSFFVFSHRARSISIGSNL